VPELSFKGKEFVYNHHLAVPYHPFIPHPEKSIRGNFDGNLIIHGDNLIGLKALLPAYAGKVDCVYIDPPYNTGNEKWVYNDNVNSPIMREWLKKTVDRDDLLRHDKWLCMMYPRLRILYELMAESGSIFISIDDNEVHRLRSVLDEIFGESNFAAQITVLCNPKGRGLSHGFADTHEYVLAYIKSEHDKDFSSAKSKELIEEEYPDLDAEGKRYRLLELRNTHREFGKHNRKNLWFALYVNPKNQEVSLQKTNGAIEVWPRWDDGYEGCWSWSTAKVLAEGELLTARLVAGKWKIFKIDYAEGARRKAVTVWSDPDVHSEKGQGLYQQIMGERFPHPPKALGLIQRIVNLGTREDSLVLDSFAGSGTTAHAVMSLNALDGGNRKFILVELEDYADKTTAERVRRVINGYKFTGTQKEELLRKKLTLTSLKKADKLLGEVDVVQNLEGHRFGNVAVAVDDGYLVVRGENEIKKRVEGLGGSFEFYTLGEATDLDAILTGKWLPDFTTLGGWLFHTATGKPIEPAAMKPDDWYVGETSVYYVWLIYKPDLEFLRSRNSALSLPVAEKIAKAKTGKRHLVFAPAKFVPNKLLLPLGVEHVPIPFSLYRLEKS
jgi:adenine-specific DNA-methyltransferase